MSRTSFPGFWSFLSRLKVSNLGHFVFFFFSWRIKQRLKVPDIVLVVTLLPWALATKPKEWFGGKAKQDTRQTRGDILRYQD